MNTPTKATTKATSKKSSFITKSMGKLHFGSPMDSNNEERRSHHSKSSKRSHNLSYQRGQSNNLLATKYDNNPAKLNEVYIEDRFTRTWQQPLKWYEHKITLDSPYEKGAKNLRYVSPNYVSNAVFYDQNTNFSIQKQEMYQTSTQRFYTPPKSQSSSQIKYEAVHPQPQNTYSNPSKYKLGSKKSDISGSPYQLNSNTKIWSSAYKSPNNSSRISSQSSQFDFQSEQISHKNSWNSKQRKPPLSKQNWSGINKNMQKPPVYISPVRKERREESLRSYESFDNRTERSGMTCEEVTTQQSKEVSRNNWQKSRERVSWALLSIT